MNRPYKPIEVVPPGSAVVLVQRATPGSSIPFRVATEPPTTESSVAPSSPAPNLIPPDQAPEENQSDAPQPAATIPPESQPAAPTPVITPAPPSEALSRKQQRSQLLQRKLSELVQRDIPAKQAKQKENLANYASQNQYDVARQVAQSSTVQAEIMASSNQGVLVGLTSNLNTLFSTQNPLGVAASTLGAIVGQSASVRGAEGGGSTRAYQPAGYGSDTEIYPAGVTTAASRAYYKNWSTQLPVRLGNGNISLIFPLPVLAPITSNFGWRVHPITGDQRFHAGTDLAAPLGTPVVAVYTGRVEVADVQSGYGLAITLSHNKGTQQTLYAHLSEILVKPGDWVEQGTVIGRVGSTGNSTGPHLHFEFWQLTPEGWIVLDPGPQLEYALAQLEKAIQAAQTANQPSS
ncbi:hypothetical protein BST81_22390 [Leptolyngbya sp. 'hensonii']|nr:hypothetical protein BST81_22390 [Leptolyngbya sp. 'hensonii']